MKQSDFISRSIMRSALVVAVLAATSSGAVAQTGDDRFAPVTQFQFQQLTERLDQLDRLVSGSGMAEISGSIATFERELRQLRGEVETLNFQHERAIRTQRDRIEALEQRLDALESGEAPLTPSEDEDASTTSSAEPPVPVEVDGAESTEASPVATPRPIDDGERREYQRAFDAMMAGENEAAAERFSAFLDAYPEGQFAGDAWYWMGETHYARGDSVAAIEMFGTVVDRFPDSSRHADAKLKLGYAHGDAGELDRARAILEDVRDEHDGSVIGRLAEDRLRRLEGAQ